MPDGTPDLTSVTAVSASNVWAAGPGVFPGNRPPVLLHYDGTSWSKSTVPAITPAPSPGQGSITINGMSSTSASDVWAVGTIGIGSQALPLILHWNGTAWSQQPAPSGIQSLNAVSASAPDDAWAVGASASGTPTLHWDGHSWTPEPSPRGFVSVADISPHSAVAVGFRSAATPGHFQNVVMRWDGTVLSTTPAAGSSRPRR